MREIRTVSVAGAGTMGHGFAQLFAMSAVEAIKRERDRKLYARLRLFREEQKADKAK